MSATPTRSRVRPAPSVWKAGKPRWRLTVRFLVTAGILVAVVARVGMLQTVDKTSLASEGERQRLFNVTLPADRGAIFDHSGFELALSTPQTTLWADPRAVVDPAQTAAVLANTLKL